MRKQVSFGLDDVASFKKKLLHFANNFSRCCVLESNEWKGSANEIIAAFDSIDEVVLSVPCRQAGKNSFETLKIFYEKKNDWLFGFLSYDLKNEIEPLSSGNVSDLGF